MEKKLKSKKAFTLTELIVVIAIIGILAAVLIPSLTGYIEKAKKSAAEQEAQTFVTAYNSWLVEREISEKEYGKDIKYTYKTDAENSNYGLYIDQDGEIDSFTAYCYIELGLKEALTISPNLATAKVCLVKDGTDITGFTYKTKDLNYKVTYDASTGKLSAVAQQV